MQEVLLLLNAFAALISVISFFYDKSEIAGILSLIFIANTFGLRQQFM